MDSVTWPISRWDIYRRNVAYVQIEAGLYGTLETSRLERYTVRSGLQRLHAVEPLRVRHGRGFEVGLGLNDNYADVGDGCPGRVRCGSGNGGGVDLSIGCDNGEEQENCSRGEIRGPATQPGRMPC